MLKGLLLLAGASAMAACSGSSEGDGGGTAGSGGAAQAGSAGANSGGSAGKGGGSPGSGGGSAGTNTAGMAGTPTGAACRIGDVVYPDGSGDFQDPFSCNTCSCLDGALACTRIGCPIECPAGTVAGTSCDQCGPAGGCEIMFHGCLDQCSQASDCEDGTCVEQACKTLCR